MSDIQLKRPNLVVADLERSLRLYRDLLGFQLKHMKTSEKTSYSYPTFNFARDASLRFAIFSTASQDGVLALTELKGQPLKTADAPRDHGIVIKVDDYDGLRAKLSAAGYRLLEEGKLTTHTGATGREQAFLDDDGHTVLIYKLDNQQ